MADNNDSRSGNDKNSSESFDLLYNGAIKYVENSEKNIRTNEIKEARAIQAPLIVKRELEEQKRKDRLEWEAHCKQMKEEEDPLVRYCNDINGVIPEHEQTFEESEELYAEKSKEKEKEYQREVGSWAFESKEAFLRKYPRPKGVTVAEWEKRRKNLKRQYKQELNDRHIDQNIKEKGTPMNIFIKNVETVQDCCRCEAEKMRLGEFCEVCRLIAKINSDFVNRLKDAAQGRIR